MPKFILFCIIAFSFVSSPHLKADEDSREGDSLALVALYNSTNGPEWYDSRNWLSNEPIDKWEGIEVRNNRVFCIDLIRNDLVGELPDEIGNLKWVHYFALAFNRLEGSIPETITNIGNCQLLYLNANCLTGHIPDSISKLQNLLWLDLSNNRLTGKIPNSICSMKKLSSIDLSHNIIFGELPEKLYEMENLSKLILSDNKISGNFIEPLQNAKELKELYLNNNDMIGSLTDDLSGFTRLEVLNISYNNFSGSITNNLSAFSKLKILDISNNYFSGTIPSGLSALKDLEKFDISGNNFSGQIPKELTELPELSVLNLSYNMFQEKFDFELDSLKNLDYLYLGNNKYQFDMFEEIYSVFDRLDYYWISPQDSIGEAQTIIADLYDNIILSAECRGLNNIYQWYKDRKAFSEKSDNPFLEINNFSKIDTGVYICKITNSLIKGLRIYSKPQVLKLPPMGINENNQVVKDDFEIFLDSENHLAAKWNNFLRDVILYIHDIRGSKIYEINPEGNCTNIPVNNFSPGVYICTISDGLKSFSKKFIVR